MWAEGQPGGSGLWFWPWERVQWVGTGHSSSSGHVSCFSPTDLVTDLDFSPFDDFLLATASADRTVSGAAGRPVCGLLRAQGPAGSPTSALVRPRELALSQGRDLCPAARLL